MLSTELCAELIEYTQRQLPLEMCGLLFAEGFHPCVNAATDPTRSFRINDSQRSYIYSLHPAPPWAIVHSHPNRSAGLSPKDCALMDALAECSDEMAMVVVGCKPVEIRIFKKDGENYRLQWEWTLKPMDPETPIFYAENR